MARRTKYEALETRNHLLDVAEELFYAQGVAGTSLSQIAAEAGVTRGAIYWHFKNKVHLIQGMMDRMVCPMDAYIRSPVAPDISLRDLRNHIVSGMQHLVQNEPYRRVFEILMFKTEYVKELQPLHQQHAMRVNAYRQRLAKDLAAAAHNQKVQLPMSADLASFGLHGMMMGIFKQWMFLSDAINPVAIAQQTCDAYFKGLGFHPA